MPLPGVRSGHDPVSWPSAQISRPTPLSSVNNGGDYVAARRALLSRYAIPWLLALHDQDTTTYAALIFETVVEIENDFASDILPDQPDIDEKVLGESWPFFDEADILYFRRTLPEVVTECSVLSSD
jgi:hypothetical protein